MSLVYITMDTLVSMVNWPVLCYMYVLYRTRRRMIHDVVMAVVLKISYLFLKLLFISKKMVLHCTLARLGSKEPLYHPTASLRDTCYEETV